jgi:hypothetical protein
MHGRGGHVMHRRGGLWNGKVLYLSKRNPLCRIFVSLRPRARTGLFCGSLGDHGSSFSHEDPYGRRRLLSFGLGLVNPKFFGFGSFEAPKPDGGETPSLVTFLQEGKADSSLLLVRQEDSNRERHRHVVRLADLADTVWGDESEPG